MYPTLFDLLKNTIGIEIKPLAIVNTFGLLVAISFFAAFYVMTLELKRLEKEGKVKARKVKKRFEAVLNPVELLFNGILGFVFGWKIIYMLTNFDLVRQDSQEVIFSSQGSILWGLVLAAVFIGQKFLEYNKQKKLFPEPVEKEVTEHPYMLMGQLTIVAFIAGIIGAKVFHILEDWSNFIQDPIDAIFSLSGLTYYGGLICGGFGVVYFANKKGIRPLHMLDVGAGAMMLAYGVGRLGCHLAGDGDWGIDNLAAKPGWIPQFLWSSKYPNNVLKADPGNLIEGCTGPYCNELINPVFPTPLYEVMMCLTLFAVIWVLRKRIKIPGMLFGIYLVMNGIERFLIEKIRVNSLYKVFGIEFTQAEMISSIIVLLGVALILYSRKIYKPSATSSAEEVSVKSD